MKTKRTWIKGIAVLLCVILGAGVFVSCEKGCEHQVNKWTVEKEATCGTEGLRRGPCIVCGDIIEEKLPVNPENHVYGDWDIVTLPTSEKEGTGKAVKTCSENSEHRLSVTLPRILPNGAGYLSSKIIVPATVLNAGERALVYEHEEGNIEFTVPIAQKEFDTKSEEPSVVGDAVLLGASNHDKVRKGTGTKNEGVSAGDTPFTYEYGENYTHIYDAADRREYWLSIASDGNLYAVWKDGGKDPEEWASGTMKHLQGYAYTISFSYTNSFFYGAEDLLEGVYAWGCSADNNGDFWQQKEGTGVESVYKYGFGYYTGEYFSVISVEFTLTEDCVLDYIRLEAYHYTSANFTITDTEDGGVKCVLNKGASPASNESVEYHQETKADYPEEPVNPYGENSLKISSFDLTVNAQTLTDGTEGEIVQLDADKLYSFTVTNILPTTANFSYDPVTVYWLRPDGTEVECTFDIHDDDVLCYYNKGLKGFQFRSRYAGQNTLLFRTDSGYEKKVVIQINPITPSALYASVYEYNDTGYLWKSFTDGTQATATVYVGQSLVFKAVVPNQEKTYADAGFEAILAGVSDGAEQAAATVETVTQDGAIATKFIATKAGTYIYILRSTKNTSRRVQLTITVEEPPAITDIFCGTYTGKITYPNKGNVTVTFTSVDTAEIRTSEGLEILALEYNAETGTVTCTHKGGLVLGTEKIPVRIYVNEAYRVVFVNPTGFGSATEEVILTRAESAS